MIRIHMMGDLNGVRRILRMTLDKDLIWLFHWEKLIRDLIQRKVHMFPIRVMDNAIIFSGS